MRVAFFKLNDGRGGGSLLDPFNSSDEEMKQELVNRFGQRLARIVIDNVTVYGEDAPNDATAQNQPPVSP